RLALLLIESGVATSPGAIAHDLGHDTGAITRTLNQLEALGLLTRRRETADRRVVALTLTPEGSRIAREFRRSLAELSRSLLKGFEASDVQALVSMLKRLIMALETARPAKNAGFASRLG
ncbi:MAG TPA: MarR family transcriptional regulator, partial [Rhizomicrobium sp.]|nr:MarR family transcriptional regulator [Rhizomicrobium sp.]